MRSLYDVLGVRADDDAQAIKKAFRAAVKAHHPDLHPDDPKAALRFRHIVTANTILSNETKRAAYDLMLARDRRQIKTKGDGEFLQLKYQRRKNRWKMGAAAAVLACALAGAYGLFMPRPTAAIVELQQGDPPVAKTATVEIKKDKVATAAAAAPAAARLAEDAHAAGLTAAATGGTVDFSASAGDLPARNEGPDRTPAGAGVPAAGNQAAHAGAAVIGDTFRPGAAPFAANTTVLAGYEPPLLPRDARFYRELGIISYRVGDFPHAIASLDEAIRLDPENAVAYDIRGNAWDEIGAAGNALADYDAAIRIDPNNPVLFHDRAVMWHRKGDLDRTLGDLDRAIRSSVSDPTIYCDRGLVWYEKGSHARAIADFSRAIKLNPDFAAACIGRGLLLHRGGQFNIAFADIERTIRVSPAVFDISKRVALHP